MPHFEAHPRRPNARLWKRSAGGATFSGFVALLSAALGGTMPYLAFVTLVGR